MEEGLKIQIGADVTELIAGLSKASAALKAFGSTGTAGAKEIEKAIKQLSKSTKGLSGEELERVNTLIAKLRDLSVQLGTKAAVSINLLGDSFQGVSSDAATLTPQIEKLSDAITNIPEGSFAVSLDADVASYLPKIEGASEALVQLGRTGIIAGDQVEQALIELGKAAERAGTADILKINSAMSAIGAASDRFKATGVQAFNEFGAAVENSAKKIDIISPAISKAEKNVKVLSNQGFTIKINAETKDALAGIRFISKETKELGRSGEANVHQLEKAIKDLNKALKNGGGGAAEIEKIKAALAGMVALSVQFGNAGKAGFDKFGIAIEPLKDKVDSVAESVDNLANKTVDTKFTTNGIEASQAKVEGLETSIQRVATAGDVEVVLNVQAQQAINALTITSNALEELGINGRASITTVNAAIAQLINAAKTAEGGALDAIKLTLQEIGLACPQLGLNAANGFGLLNSSATESLQTLNGIPPAIKKISDVVNTVDGAITITPNVNEQPAVEDLGRIADKAEEVKSEIVLIGGEPIFITVDADGLDEAKVDVEDVKDELDDLKKKGDFTLDVSVDAKGAISKVEGIDQSLEKLGKTGKASLGDVEDAMQALKDAAKKPGAPIDRINAAMEQLTKLNKQFKNVGKQGFDEFGNEIEEAEKKIKKIRPVTDQANDALRDMGRIAQDAPFGFIAISNNIDPLFQSLGNLSEASGGLKGALSALGKSLIGPAGIAFAVSAVTSIVTEGIQKYGSLGNAVDALFGKIDHLKESQKALLESQQEANKGAAEELVRLKTLTTIAQDTNRTYAERIQAVKLLREQFPSYFKELKTEEVLNGNLSTAIAGTTKEILKRARARAIESKLIDSQSKILDIESQRDNLLRDREAAYKRVAKTQDLVIKNGVRLVESADSKAARDEIEKLDESLRVLGEGLIPIAKDAQFLQDEISKIGGVKLDNTKDGSFDANKEAIELLKTEIAAQEELNKTKAKTGGIDQALLANKIKLIQLEGEQNKSTKETTAARIAAVRAETNLSSLNERIALLEKQKAAVGLLAKDEQKLINLRAQAAKIEFGQGAAQDVISAARIEGLEADIKKLEELRDKVGLLRSEANRLTDLKLDLFDLKNINSEFTPGQVDELRRRIVAEVNTGSQGVVMRIPTIIEPVDTKEEIIKKVTDLFPESGFKIPINIAAAVQPLPAVIGEQQRDEARLAQVDAIEDRYRGLAETISSEVAPVFTSLFDSIGQKGVSALDVLGDALKQIIKKLIAAAAQAAIFSAIMSAVTGGIPGGGGFVKGFLSSFKGILGLGAANLGSQNRQFVQGNAANLGRDELYTQLRGRDIDIMIRRNNSSNNRYS